MMQITQAYFQVAVNFKQIKMTPYLFQFIMRKM